ncbi:uncharacterized protein [Nicotiana tomentosiformis]|uniref:uncharacterized protein n=1 Tax=Nicotiana tomentosiformis TaxID=4098 RepID=UPI00388C9A27
MAKISKSVPQKETPSASRPAVEETVSHTAAAEEPTPEPPLKLFIPTGCPTGADFKNEKTSSVPGRCEPVSRYICSITEDVLSEVKKDCNWANKHVVFPKPEEAITTDVEGLPKDVEMRPPSGDDDIPTEPSASGQDRETKRKRAPSSPGPEKKKLKKSLALVLHHEAFRRYRKELKQLEAEVRELTKKRDAFKFLSEQFEGETKSFRAELKGSRKEYIDLTKQVNIFEISDDELNLVTDGQNPQVQQKLDRIAQLQAEMDIVKAEAEEWRGRMDHLDSEKEAVRAQLNLTEIQLRAVKERAGVQTKRVEELQLQLGSTVSNRKNLAKELETAKSVAVVVKADADEMVAQYKDDAEAAQDLVKNLIEHMKWQSRREVLKEVHARGFDLSIEIEDAKVLEAEAMKLAYPEEEIPRT